MRCSAAAAEAKDVAVAMARAEMAFFPSSEDASDASDASDDGVDDGVCSFAPAFLVARRERRREHRVHALRGGVEPSRDVQKHGALPSRQPRLRDDVFLVRRMVSFSVRGFRLLLPEKQKPAVAIRRRGIRASGDEPAETRRLHLVVPRAPGREERVQRVGDAHSPARPRAQVGRQAPRERVRLGERGEVRRERKRARRVADETRTRRVLVGPSLVGRFAVRLRANMIAGERAVKRVGVGDTFRVFRVFRVVCRRERHETVRPRVGGGAHPGHRRHRDARRASVPRPRRARFQRGHRCGLSARVPERRLVRPDSAFFSFFFFRRRFIFSRFKRGRRRRRGAQRGVQRVADALLDDAVRQRRDGPLKRGPFREQRARASRLGDGVVLDGLECVAKRAHGARRRVARAARADDGGECVTLAPGGWILPVRRDGRIRRRQTRGAREHRPGRDEPARQRAAAPERLQRRRRVRCRGVVAAALGILERPQQPRLERVAVPLERVARVCQKRVFVFVFVRAVSRDGSFASLNRRSRPVVRALGFADARANGSRPPRRPPLACPSRAPAAAARAARLPRRAPRRKTRGPPRSAGARGRGRRRKRRGGARGARRRPRRRACSPRAGAPPPRRGPPRRRGPRARGARPGSPRGSRRPSRRRRRATGKRRSRPTRPPRDRPRGARRRRRATRAGRARPRTRRARRRRTRRGRIPGAASSQGPRRRRGRRPGRNRDPRSAPRGRLRTS